MHKKLLTSVILKKKIIFIMSSFLSVKHDFRQLSYQLCLIVVIFRGSFYDLISTQIYTLTDYSAD